MKSALKWLVPNIAFALCLYYGFFEGVEGAKNVAEFAVSFMFCVSLLIFLLPKHLSEDIEKKAAAVPRVIPETVDVLFDIGVIVTLVWVGQLLFAGLYIFHALQINGMCYPKPKPAKESAP